jgi:hypothetical protein
VGLVPANQGYAIHNTSTGHLVDYFAYDNEQVFQPDVVDVVVHKPAISATPYINPFTNGVDPNATCFSNPVVYFSRGGTSEPPFITTQDEVSLHLSPNPAVDYLEISVKASSEPRTIEHIEIMDAIGNKRVDKAESPVSDWRVSMSGLKNGYYSVVVYCSDGTVLRGKFIKVQ